VFFAAMRQVDVAQIEAALLDGASLYQLMRFILIPAIRPTITLMMIMTVIWSIQRIVAAAKEGKSLLELTVYDGSDNGARNDERDTPSPSRGAIFLAFDFVYVLTQGGPAYSSEVLSTLSYRYAFYNYTIGPAAAVALVISFFGLIATAFYVRVQQRGET
jgi:raffinose/stachyose/melibiose transport system permease protein